MLQYLLGMGWFAKALVAMLGMAVAWIFIGLFMGRHFAVKPEVILICYYTGIVSGSLSLLLPTRLLAWSDFMVRPGVTLCALLLGLTLGATLNILFFNGLSQAPNQGLAVAVLNFAPVVIFLATLGLARALPTLFQSGSVHWWQVLGLLLSIIGVTLIAIKK